MDKVLTVEQAIEKSKKLKQESNKIILAGGCFDILHLGHLKFLNQAKKLGGWLMVLLESDETVKRLKGPERPIIPQEERAMILANLNVVDFVVLLPEFRSGKDYFSLVKELKPDIIAVTKGDPKKDKKSIQAEAIGAKVVEVIEKEKGFSTTELINKIKK